MVTIRGFVNAVRVFRDPTKKRDVAMDVDTVRLAVFDKEGGGVTIRVSLRDSDATSYYTYFMKGQDLSDVKVAQLIADPTHLDVYYLIFKGEERAFSRPYITKNEPVCVYIAQILSDFEATAESPQRPSYKPVQPQLNGTPKKPLTPPKKDYLTTMTRDMYIDHIMRTIYFPSFLQLLRAPKDGYTISGQREDGEGNEEHLLLMVEQAKNFDEDSTSFYASFATKRRKLQ